MSEQYIWKIRVLAEVTKERADELFEAIADLAHERDEMVVCSMIRLEADDE